MQPRLLVRAATSADDHTLRFWDLEGNQPPRVLEGDAIRASAWAVSCDGQRAVSGSEDHTVRVWDLESGNCLAVFTCDDKVFSCAWARERIVAGDGSGQGHPQHRNLQLDHLDDDLELRQWTENHGWFILCGTETHTVTSVSVPPAGSYDGVVNAGSSTPSGDLGFQATWPGGTNAVPAISINGTACTMN